MFSDLKQSLLSFKKNWADYLGVSFVFGVILFIAFLLGRSILGFLLAYVVIAIPAIISLKFFAMQSYDKNQIEYRSLKIGFLTFFKSIRIYFVVVLKPIIIGLFVGVLMYSIFFEFAINIASDSIPKLFESLSNYDTMLYAYEEMLEIEKVKDLLDIGVVASFVVGYIIYFVLKLKRDFIPFVAFEMPISSNRAVTMNAKMLNKRYFQFLLNNLLILLTYSIPFALAYLTKSGLESNDILSTLTVDLVSGAVFCIVSSPIVMFNQLYYVHAYKSYSKPLKEDFNNELRNVIKEMEEITKSIDKNDEK